MFFRCVAELVRAALTDTRSELTTTLGMSNG